MAWWDYIQNRNQIREDNPFDPNEVISETQITDDFGRVHPGIAGPTSFSDLSYQDMGGVHPPRSFSGLQSVMPHDLGNWRDDIAINTRSQYPQPFTPPNMLDVSGRVGEYGQIPGQGNVDMVSPKQGFQFPNFGIGRLIEGIKDQFEYRPATEEAWDSRTGTYLSAEEQDKQNALGGYYSNAARDARRTRARVLNMIKRRDAGLEFNEERLKRFEDLGYGPEEIITDTTVRGVVPPDTGRVTRDTSGWSSPGYTTRGGFTEPSRTTGTQHGGAGTRDVRGHHGNFSQGGRIGYANGELVDEDINVQGPGFDVNENIEMASAQDPMDALNDMAMQIFGKPLHELTPDEKQILFDMANEQAAAPGAEQGIASLV